jgi:hypothetical protein
MKMLIDPKTGRKILTAGEAAAMFGCTTTHIARLARGGELRRRVENCRAVFYDLEDVKRLAKEKAEIRKKRGGRPPERDQAA